MKLFNRKLGSGAVFTLHPKRVRLWRRVSALHAMPDGGPVLRSESSWRTINGVAFVFRKSTLLVEFRRRSVWRR
jgi:hypothetical protein